jgi:diguanylate cyclase (GGDEF)-like protein
MHFPVSRPILAYIQKKTQETLPSSIAVVAGEFEKVRTAAHTASTTDPLVSSYIALATALVGELAGVCLLDGALNSRGHGGDLQPESLKKWIESVGWDDLHVREPVARAHGARRWVSAMPIEQSDGVLLGVFCVCQDLVASPTQPSRYAKDLGIRLKPLLDCIHRDFAAAIPVRSKLAVLTERTAELEWLFQVTNNLKDTAVDDQHIIEELLAAATLRLSSALGVLWIPDKRLIVKHEAVKAVAAQLSEAWSHTQQHLLSWVQRQNRPLVINAVGRSGKAMPKCKIMCVPVVKDSSPVIGVLAFYNPPEAPDYINRATFLARHIGRQAATVVAAQFDLMTGLYTRSGLDQMASSLMDADECVERSVLYLDIDHMHVVNELHGFELGNELIVRIADLLSNTSLPEGSLAARISGDRFVVILSNSTSQAALQLAETLQSAAARLVIGPAKQVIDVSISCGISALMPMPDGLARAIAAAELACKTAKQRGRNRVEIYAIEDGSMMRRHSDAMAVGSLRAALKSDRLMLFAQRIAPLQDRTRPGGYEVLLRLQEIDGTLVAPGPLIDAAQRYQLLPSIDRWVVHRALQLLAPYRSMFRTRGISMSVNVSGQSIGDDAFIQTFTQLLKDSNLPRGCISVELTEQAAITNVVHAKKMVAALSQVGCGFALDDFGTGANSLGYLKALNVNRVKIEGSFVRDILSDRNSQATVKAIVELAKGLGIETVAEYVETQEIADAVTRLGVDYAQGYAFGRPEPLAEILDGLAHDESRRLHRLFLES